MKKIAAIIVCGVCSMALLVGCGEKATEASIEDNSIAQEVNEESNSEESKIEAKSIDKKDVPEGLNYEFVDRHYGFKLWVSTMGGSFNDAGTSYRFSKNTEDDRADLFIMKYTVDGSYTDAETCELSKITSSKDIFDGMKGKFIEEIPMKSKLQEVNSTNLETSTINGVEMTKFEGNFTEKYGESDGGDFAFVGYQILAKNRPVLVFVVDRQPSEDNSNIQQFYGMVDDIVSTFVDEEGGTKEAGYLE